jgi:hypothetical protein
MNTVILTARGRTVTAADLADLRALQAAHPGASRRALSQRLCEHWDWRQPNGALRDMVARSLLLTLHRAGHLTLPPVRQQPPNNAIARRRPRALPVDTSALARALPEVQPVALVAVRHTPQEGLYDHLIAQYHYLGVAHGVGEQVKYLAVSQGRPLACLGFTSAPRHLAPRDRFIGWSPAVRRVHVHELAYNTRFLILPWVQVPHLASHLLGQVARRIAGDWSAGYGHPVHYLETFVDPERFQGTCYRAANWQVLGLTTGRGKDDLTHQPNRSCKQVLGLPLHPDFRRRLGVGA